MAEDESKDRPAGWTLEDEAEVFIGTVDGLLKQLRASSPESMEFFEREPRAAALWSFMLWARHCRSGGTLRDALQEFVSIFQDAAAKMEPGEGGKPGRPTDDGVTLARVMKSAGATREDICASVIPGYAGMNHRERQEVWQRLRDRMRNQRKYEQRRTGHRGDLRGGAGDGDPAERGSSRERPTR